MIYAFPSALCVMPQILAREIHTTKALYHFSQSRDMGNLRRSGQVDICQVLRQDIRQDKHTQENSPSPEHQCET